MFVESEKLILFINLLNLFCNVIRNFIYILNKITFVFICSSMENEVRNADDSLSIESRLSEHKPVKRGKGRPPKNASTFDALDIITEQTLRVIIYS